MLVMKGSAENDCYHKNQTLMGIATYAVKLIMILTTEPPSLPQGELGEVFHIDIFPIIGACLCLIIPVSVPRWSHYPR